jgi:hypothetical protein
METTNKTGPERHDEAAVCEPLGETQPAPLLAVLDTPAPSAEGGTSGRQNGARHQPWCAADVPAGAQRCPRCQVWQPSNTGALTHGGRRLQQGHESPLNEARRAELVARILSDLGGAEACSAVLSELVSDFAFACVLRDVCAASISATGPLTRVGRRRAVVDLYLSASTRAERLASQIGLSRVAKRVPSLQEYLRDRAATPTSPTDGEPS